MDPAAQLTDPDPLAIAWVLITDPANIATALIAVNFLAFAAFGLDPL